MCAIVHLSSTYESTAEEMTSHLCVVSPITRVDKEDDGVDCWEIIFPHSSRLVVAAKIKGGESERIANCELDNL